MKNIALIFAGGIGKRMHSKDLPKQFLSIHDKPIIIRTIEHFQKHEKIDAIVVVCVAEYLDYCKQLITQYNLTKVISVVPGGETGQLSIYNGLVSAKKLVQDEPTCILIHDGVRPLINKAVISNCISSVEKYGSAITCVKAKETVLEIKDQIVEDIPNRDSLLLARAPQCFILDELLQEHETALLKNITTFIDSASMMKSAGYQLHTVLGPEENIKVTTPDDFFLMRAILDLQENKQIYGIDD